MESRPRFEPGIRKIFAEHHHSCCEGLYALFPACLLKSCRAALEWLQVPSNPYLSFQQIPSARTFTSSITLATRWVPLFRNGCVYEKTTFQWLKSTKLGIMINRDTRPILLDVDLRGYFLIKGRANGWTESGLLVNKMHLLLRVHFLICSVCRYLKSHSF